MKEFDNILNECLERLLVRGEPLEQCLGRYPGRATELRPLLETALAAKKASAIQPRPEFRARARYQFRLSLQEKAAPRGRPFFGWLPQWATALTIVLVLLLAGGGTIATASNSMPDSFLYPVKLATEEVQLALTPSQVDKAQLCANFADERVAEIIYMAEKGDAEQVELITQRLGDDLEMLAVYVSGPETGEDMLMMAAATEESATATAEDSTTATEEESSLTAGGGAEAGAGDDGGKSQNGNVQAGNGRAEHDAQSSLTAAVADSASNNPAVLRAMLENVPASVREALQRAIEVSEAGYAAVLAALGY